MKTQEGHWPNKLYCPSQIENPKKTHLDTSGPLCAMEISSPPGSPQVLGLSPPHHGSCTWSIMWFIMISVSQKISRSLDSDHAPRVNIAVSFFHCHGPLIMSWFECHKKSSGIWTLIATSLIMYREWKW